LISTHDYDIIFGNLNVIDQLEGFCDANYITNFDTWHSCIRYVLSCGNNTISWSSQSKKCTSISSMEIKYLVICAATKEAIWFYHLSFSMGVPHHHLIVIYGDNQSAINLLKNLQFNKRNKNIDVQCHFVHDKYKNTKISIDYISINNQVVNIMTRFLPCEFLKMFHHLMGVGNIMTRFLPCEFLKMFHHLMGVGNIMTRFLPCEFFKKFHHLMGVVNMNSLPLIAYWKQDGDMGHIPTT
jgi:hypothetical protein